MTGSRPAVVDKPVTEESITKPLKNRAAREWIFVDNEVHLHDPEKGEFVKNDGNKLSLEDVERSGMHLAHYRIVEIQGKLFYMDERLKELRRVGNGSESMSFDDYDVLDSKGVRLTVPKGKRFKKLMKGERELLERMVGGDADNDRGGSK